MDLLSSVDIGSVGGDNGANNAVGVFHGNVSFGNQRNAEGSTIRAQYLLALT
jgi:hypothetical protein